MNKLNELLSLGALVIGIISVLLVKLGILGEMLFCGLFGIAVVLAISGMYFDKRNKSNSIEDQLKYYVK